MREDLKNEVEVRDLIAQKLDTLKKQRNAVVSKLEHSEEMV